MIVIRSPIHAPLSACMQTTHWTQIRGRVSTLGYIIHVSWWRDSTSLYEGVWCCVCFSNCTDCCCCCCPCASVCAGKSLGACVCMRHRRAEQSRAEQSASAGPIRPVPCCCRARPCRVSWESERSFPEPAPGPIGPAGGGRGGAGRAPWMRARASACVQERENENERESEGVRE